MLRVLASCGLAALLVGCLSNNGPTNTLHYAGGLFASVENYQLEAARIVKERDADPGFVRVSRPRLMVDQTPSAANQWYVCLRGIPEPSYRPGLFAAVARLLESWFPSMTATGVYDVVLTFPEGQRPVLSDGFDLPECRNLEFEFITAEAPSGA